ncbi:MAG TPA: DUF4124 domain-containing protein [Gammaproteobacteria bacterium]|jgi:hypothetical protein
MGKWLIVLPMLYATALVAEPAWTWVDANGQRHYSDRPVEGATRVELSGAQGFATTRPAPTPQATRNTSAPANAAAAAPAYRSFTISSPVNEQTLWNIETVLNVSVGIEPGLQPGHRIDAYLDGQRVVIAALSQQFTVPEVYRGMHTLYAVIRDSGGHEVRRSPEVTFMVQQTSIQNPQNPNRPQAPPPRPTPR